VHDSPRQGRRRSRPRASEALQYEFILAEGEAWARQGRSPRSGRRPPPAGQVRAKPAQPNKKWNLKKWSSSIPTV